MARIAVFAAAAIIFLFLAVAAETSGTAAAEPLDALIKDQAKSVETDQVNEYWRKLMDEYGGFFPDNQAPSVMEMILPGGKGFGFKQAVKGLAAYLFHELLVNGKLLATIIVLSVFSQILQTLQGAFEKSAISKIAYAIVYMVLIIIAVNSFSVAIGYAKTAIEHMVQFMVAMIPLLLTMLASMGNVVSASVMHPLIVFMVNAVGTLIYTFVFPLLFFSALLHIVSTLSDNYKVTQLADLLRKVSVAMLGIFLTVFLGVISVQGAAGAVTDGVTLRTAKYVTGNFVPVVGSLFSDAADTVISASLLVKNAIGLVGVVIIVLLCAFPAVKILALAFVYNLSAAVLQPLGKSPITKCLDTIGKNLIYVFAALATVGLMFFLAVTVIISAGNLSVMMR